MVIITRRKNERVMIGADVTVAVLQISAQQVRLAIDAPKDIPVDREEVYRKKQAARGQRP